MKEETKKIFLDFFNEPANSERRNKPGIYTSYYHVYGDKTLQIILLDTRTNRDDLIKFDPLKGHQTDFFYTPDYIPHFNSDSTLLGETQWNWLEKELTKKADIRLIASSTQFGIAYNGYEAWANFPHEMEKMAHIIRKTGAEGVLFISGDVHYAEISKRDFQELYPLYDVTSSGITSTWDFATPNKYRIEGPVMENHFGLITIDWNSEIPTIKIEIIDITGNQRIEYSIPLDLLMFR
jgi:alkaline phosphatase D